MGSVNEKIIGRGRKQTVTESEIKKILNIQRNYYASGKTLSYKRRMEALKILRKGVLNYKKELENALEKDLGKSKTEGYMCEIGLTLSELSWMEKHLKNLMSNKRVRTPLGQYISTSFQSPSPYGTVLIMSPWNYPILLTLEPLIDAIAAGNTVILKPSAYAPNVAKVIEKMIKEYYSPAFVYVVNGGRAENKVLLEQKFDMIFFTGSKNVGKEVLRRAAEHLTPVVLELGGKSPCIVERSAKIKLAARRIVFGKYLNCGQTCVAPDYILCDKKIEKQLIEEIKKEIKRQFCRTSKKSMEIQGKMRPLYNKNYGKIINEKHFDRLMGLIDEKKVVCGGGADRASLRIEPTVMANVTWEDAVMQEEIFGPILPILTYDSLDEAIDKIRKHPHPLALYCFTERKAVRRKVLEKCRFGGGCINDTIIHLATSNMPFGGVGESGMGCYHGKEGFLAFSHTRSIVDKKTYLDLPIRYQPYGRIKDFFLSVFLR